MTEEELRKHKEFLIKEIEFYTGRKLPKVTEKQLSDARASLLAWDKAGRPFDESVSASTAIGSFPVIGPVKTQKKLQKSAES